VKSIRGIALGALLVGGAHCAAPHAVPARFAKHDRARLAELIAERRETASILIAYPPGHGAELLQRLTALGARVRYQADTVGYIRIDLATGRIRTAAALPGIDAINIDGTQVYGASVQPDLPPRALPRSLAPPAQDTVRAASRWRLAPPDSSTPRENPYLPLRDVGAPQFVAAHPTFDGRGVTIGSIECCPDFRHPVFQEPALTLDGKPTRKLAAVYLVVADDSEATNRVHARDWVEVVGGRFTYDGVSYRAPRDGRLRIGYYTGATGFHTYRQMVGDTLEALRQRRPVLLDPRSGEVWVDVLGDRDFSHAPALRDYNATGDVSAFGRDDPTTPWDDRLSFVVRVDTAGVVDVFPGNNSHVTAVAGIAVGTRVYGSAATGAAPHARMVFVDPGGSWKAAGSTQSYGIEAMILLARRPDVDIITTQEWLDLRLKDGGSVWSIVSDRLVTTYHKVLLQGAGNDPGGVGAITEEVNGEHVMKVGGSIDRDTWYTTLALLADRKDYLFNVTSGGPRADGGPAPDFVTPEVDLEPQPMGSSGDSLFRYNTGMFSSQIIYRNPPGYTLQFGTSNATPTAAGATALLLSAARQRGTPVDPARLHWALASGARYIPEYQTYEQGNGILEVGAAWDRLQRAATPSEIRIDAPVRTVMSPYLRRPGHGRGLYEREGWAAGDSATRTVTLTRTTGPAGEVAYHLRWLGNDGTFAAPASVRIARNRPVALPIVVHPQSWGAHSALLQLVGDDGWTLAGEISVVVVAAHPLDAAHQYTVAEQGQAEWLGKTSYFVSVPRGAAALDLSLAIAHGAVMFALFDPSGGIYPSAAPMLHGRHYGWPDDVAIGYTPQQSSGVLRRTIEYPEAGVWEVVVWHEGSATPELRLKPQTAATFTFAASVTGMTAEPAIATARTTRVTLHNVFAATNARLVGGVASVARERLTLSPKDSSVVRELMVDSGTTRLAVHLSQPSDPAADVDVHLFDCTSGRCERHVSAVFRGAEKELRVQDPRPGRWRIVIDPYDVPAGVTSVEYQDEIVNPKYGALTVVDPLVHLPPGGVATVSVAVRTGEDPGPGRERALRLEAHSTVDQAALGSGGTKYRRGVLGVVRAAVPK
jgi:hypothetical protein